MILITGGTGLVGSHLLYFLLDDGQEVRAIYRKDSNLEAVKHVFSYYTSTPEKYFNQIDWVEADLNDIPALSSAFKEVDIVYHAAAYVSFDPRDFQKLKKINIEGTANIVNLCLHHKIKKLCHLSSIATMSKTGVDKIDEEMFWNPDEDNNVYAISKYGAEMEVWRGTQEGLDAIVLNPGVILGSGFWNKGTGVIFSKLSKGISYFTNGVMGFVDVIDVVQSAILLMESSVKNERFILVSENESYKNLLSSIAKKFGKKPPNKELKGWMLSIGQKLNFLKSFLTGKKQLLFKSTAKSILIQRKYNNKKLIASLNYTFTPLDKTLKVIVENYKKDKLNL